MTIFNVLVVIKLIVRKLASSAERISCPLGLERYPRAKSKSRYAFKQHGLCPQRKTSGFDAMQLEALFPCLFYVLMCCIT